MAEGRWRALWCLRSEMDWDILCDPIDGDRFVECAEARIKTKDASPDDEQGRWREMILYTGVGGFNDCCKFNDK